MQTFEPAVLPAALRVLVVDDEHLVAAGLAAHVRAIGHECVGIAASGLEACAKAGVLHPDIALMDIQMPGNDGISVAAELWESKGVPSIIVSAYADAGHIERSQRPGIFGYLLKPTSEAQLRAAISVAIARATDAQTDAERVERLETSLSNRRTIEQAKWLLVETKDMSEAEAHAWLQQVARETRRRAVDVAADLLAESGRADLADPDA